jgi:hypothetical protein
MHELYTIGYADHSIDRTYAVGVQTDRLLAITAYFACSSMVRFCLFPEHVAQRATCSGKSMSHSTLPEAHRAGCPGRRLGLEPTA